MGSIIIRGTRDNPKYFIKYREADGTQRMKLSKQRTKAEAKTFLAEVEARVGRGLPGIPDPVPENNPLIETQLGEWKKTLTNRNAGNDKSAVDRVLVPAFKGRKVRDLSVRSILAWLASEREKAKDERVSESTLRGYLNLLSRFCSWCVEQELIPVNPVRQIPSGRRPRDVRRTDRPWIGNDKPVRDALSKMDVPYNFIFYLGNRSGMRPGEIVGLRISDFDFVDEGVLRVRGQYDGQPLKEDKRGEGKVKWVPAPADVEVVLGPWLAQRQAAGAQPEDHAFPEQVAMHKKSLSRRMARELAKAGIEGMTFYESGRHSFVSRTLSRGASLDEVSAAVGHSSPMVTKRYYDHFVRKSFSSVMREGVGAKQPKGKGKVIQMKARKTER